MTDQTSSPLVTPQWLAENIEAPDLRVVEATWFPPWTHEQGAARAAYEEAHIPGAVFFDIEAVADPDAPLPHTFPSPILFSSRARHLGIGDGNRIIVYDRNGFCASARAWWMLRAMGVLDVRVLDGGWAGWQAIGGEIEDMPPVPAERHFTARLRGDLLKSVDQVEKLSETAPNSILDARPAGRFTGEEPEPREGLASGHIPGSRNIPASSVLTPQGRIRPAAELEQLFADIPSGPVVTTCGSGITACILALALATIGRDDAAVYDGSWSEWAEGGTRPIATGSR